MAQSDQSDQNSRGTPKTRPIGLPVSTRTLNPGQNPSWLVETGILVVIGPNWTQPPGLDPIPQIGPKTHRNAIWDHLGPFGAIWDHLGPFGTIWGHLGPFGAIVDHLGPFGAIWDHLEPFGAIWSHLGPFGAIWDHLEPFGAIWSHLDLFQQILTV